jgi:hypothetical protein
MAGADGCGDGRCGGEVGAGMSGGAGGLAVYQPLDPKEFFANRNAWVLETNDGVEDGWRPVGNSFAITFNSDGSLRFPKFWRMRRQTVFVSGSGGGGGGAGTLAPNTVMLTSEANPLREILSVLRSIDQKLSQPKVPNCPVCGVPPGGKHV